MSECEHEDLYIVRDHKGRPLTELGWYLCGKCAASFIGVFPDVDEHGFCVHPPPTNGVIAGSGNKTRYVNLGVAR